VKTPRALEIAIETDAHTDKDVHWR
jgi:hypothetical protein